jgi:hypothetical protein
VTAKKRFSLALKDKIAGAFTNSSSFAGDKRNTLQGLIVNAMQHGRFKWDSACFLPTTIGKQ